MVEDKNSSWGRALDTPAWGIYTPAGGQEKRI